MNKFGHLFLAAILSTGLFTELRIGAFTRFEDGNDFPWMTFVCAARPDWSGFVPENWRCRALSMDLSAAWCKVLGVSPDKAASDRGESKEDRMIIWVKSLQDRDCLAFALYNAAFFFITCVALLIVLERPLLPMLGTFASILTSAPGSLSPYLLPWDLPTLAAWTGIFAMYSKLKDSRSDWIWLALVISVLGMLNETVLVTALFFIGAPWSWLKRMAVIAGTVVASQLLNWALSGAQPDWVFASSAGAGSSTGHWNPLMLWPIVLANSGSVVLMPWLLWRRRDVPLGAACAAFIVLMTITFLNTGIYAENRDWLELAPIGWMLISEQAAKTMDAR